MVWIRTQIHHMKKGLNISPCAQRETRTPMPFRAPPPQDGASTNFASWANLVSDSAGDRTQDPLIKSQMLYQLSYRINVNNERPLKMGMQRLPIQQPHFLKWTLNPII